MLDETYLRVSVELFLVELGEHLTKGVEADIPLFALLRLQRFRVEGLFEFEDFDQRPALLEGYWVCRAEVLGVDVIRSASAAFVAHCYLKCL